MKILIIYLQITFSIFAQYWKTAPEVWSEPVLIDTSVLNQKWTWYDTPAVTSSLDTIYYTGGNGVYRAARLSNVDRPNWEITRLNSNINLEGQYAPKSCSISRDGKRLYVSSWGGYGGLDLWKSEWDDTLNDWGKLTNMGKSINQIGSGLYLYEVSKDTVYCVLNRIGLADVYSFVFNYQTNKWNQIDSLFHNAVGINSKFGLSLNSNSKKLYSAHLFYRTDTSVSLNYSRKRSVELAVSYWDSDQNNWSDGQYLNINSVGYFPDSLNWPNFIAGGIDVYPWISEDGKVLVFSSIRNVIIDSTGNGDTNPKLYISYLQKDENGNPVSVNLDKNNTPFGYILYPNFPNPFNGSTIISYNLPNEQKIKIKIYDILGKEIATILDEKKSQGMNTISFDPNLYNLSSGTYIYSLLTEQDVVSKRMTYLK